MTPEMVNSDLRLRLPELLARVKRSSLLLRFLKYFQGILGTVWIATLLLFILFNYVISPQSYPRSLLFAFVISIPCALPVLAFGQVWSRNANDRFYQKLKSVVAKGDMDAKERKRARAALFRYQLYSKPPLVKGEATNSLAIVTLLASLAFVVLLTAVL